MVPFGGNFGLLALSDTINWRPKINLEHVCKFKVPNEEDAIYINSYFFLLFFPEYEYHIPDLGFCLTGGDGWNHVKTSKHPAEGEIALRQRINQSNTETFHATVDICVGWSHSQQHAELTKVLLEPILAPTTLA